jgi:hypothetical protein
MFYTPGFRSEASFRFSATETEAPCRRNDSSVRAADFADCADAAWLGVGKFLSIACGEKIYAICLICGTFLAATFRRLEPQYLFRHSGISPIAPMLQGRA